MKKYILEISVFICGAVVMVFELVGSRVLGPFFGTSIFVWTSLIGIILGSLSLGYYFGGKIADKNPSFSNLSLIVFLSAIFIGLTVLIKEPLLLILQNSSLNIKTGSVLASLILFLPTSVLLGMVSPYSAKLKINSLDTSGSTIGTLYALSTAGSIFGTFLAGFYLIPQFGTNKMLLILVFVLIIVSILIYSKRNLIGKVFVLIFVLASWISFNQFNSLSEKNGFIDVDTTYNRILISEHKDIKTDRIVRVMGINNENHSSMFLDSDELVNEYSKYFHLAKYFNPNFKKSLVFGGAGYSYPKDYLLKYPDATIDVVEIDSKITELAKKYFNLKENPRLTIYHEDGRVYLNKTLARLVGKEKYDVIFGDAFGSRYSIPYQLTTKEAVQKKYDILNENGVVVLNLISSIEGESGKFLRAEYATYKNIFPHVYVFPVGENNNGEEVQNIILIALKTKDLPAQAGKQIFSSNDPELNKYLQRVWKKEIKIDVPILTDDFAPVDYYIDKVI